MPFEFADCYEAAVFDAAELSGREKLQSQIRKIQPMFGQIAASLVLIPDDLQFNVSHLIAQYDQSDTN